MSEKLTQKHESGAEKLSESEQQHIERLKKQHETAAESAKNKHEQNEVENARHEAYERATPTAEYVKPSSETKSQATPFTKADKKRSFDTQMHHVRQNMSKPEKAFSTFIHQPLVEKTSEVAGKTIARPSGIVGAASLAFIGLLSIYGIAKFAGFELTGSEMPLLLLIGFGLGIFLEWLYKSIRAIFSNR